MYRVLPVRMTLRLHLEQRSMRQQQGHDGITPRSHYHSRESRAKSKARRRCELELMLLRRLFHIYQCAPVKCDGPLGGMPKRWSWALNHESSSWPTRLPRPCKAITPFQPLSTPSRIASTDAIRPGRPVALCSRPSRPACRTLVGWRPLPAQYASCPPIGCLLNCLRERADMQLDLAVLAESD